MAKFAKENPIIRRHLDLQERKEKLEMVCPSSRITFPIGLVADHILHVAAAQVHERLNDLVKLQQEKQAPKRHERDRRGFFGMF